ncbi:hypothetical protein OX90_07365 [Pseudomonas coronafaciens pv. porri]|uniref:Uncharacterized protein n=1 Tax=Pseudomonas coronafaciens pv. porri TaxID=83964 RepID=A0ABR5JSM6_9PSED|nr:hypothetical protein OA77_13925 [Pseudomonas coronafaciens]KOP58656.1 hypothetical protein OX88_01265 [Pseudomonas coronafaciens pv. porri]KOP60150.1 hypothetical protein OX90_07365 [Pseudomonas coronafaciens pv. porri]KPB52389.1 Unknown protein sequence [Pseudomonas coronafaciens pv. oryzae]
MEGIDGGGGSFSGYQLDDAIKRSVERQFPELTGVYYLQRLAQLAAHTHGPTPVTANAVATKAALLAAKLKPVTL